MNGEKKIQSTRNAFYNFQSCLESLHSWMLDKRGSLKDDELTIEESDRLFEDIQSLIKMVESIDYELNGYMDKLNEEGILRKCEKVFSEVLKENSSSVRDDGREITVRLLPDTDREQVSSLIRQRHQESWSDEELELKLKAIPGVISVVFT